MKKKIITLLIVIILILLLLGAYLFFFTKEPEPIYLSGVESQTTQSFTLQKGLSLFDVSTGATGQITVDLVDENENLIQTIVDKNRQYHGERALHIEKTGMYKLKITTSTTWDISIMQPRKKLGQGFPADFQNVTDDVIGPLKMQKDASDSFSMTHSGDEVFKVTILDKDGIAVETLVEKEGYAGTSKRVNVPKGVYYVQVLGGDKWSIAVDATN